MLQWKKTKNIKMKFDDSLNEFNERFNSIIIELTTLGKEYTNRKIVLKVMRVLSRK